MNIVETPRACPWGFHNQYCTENKIEITIPDNFKIERMPDDVELKLPFAFYEVKYLVEGNVIKYERNYKFNTFEISKEDAQEIVLKQ